MLSFRQFRNLLFESSWDKYLYHATYGKFNPKKIKPGSHFGTLHAAMSRAKNAEEQTEWNVPGSGEKERRKLKVYAFKYKPSGNEYKTTDQHINHLQQRDDVNTPSEMKGKGYSHATYENIKEDPGSTSTVVFDPENLEHVHTFKHPKFVTRKYKSIEGWSDTPSRHYFDRRKEDRISGK